MTMLTAEHLQGSPRQSGHREGKRSGDDVQAAYRNDSTSLKGEDALALQDLDPALNAKMHLVNNVRPCLSLDSITCADV
jgi:hypothetical protein